MILHVWMILHEGQRGLQGYFFIVGDFGEIEKRICRVFVVFDDLGKEKHGLFRVVYFLMGFDEGKS